MVNLEAENSCKLNLANDTKSLLEPQTTDRILVKSYGGAGMFTH